MPKAARLMPAGYSPAQFDIFVWYNDIMPEPPTAQECQATLGRLPLNVMDGLAVCEFMDGIRFLFYSTLLLVALYIGVHTVWELVSPRCPSEPAHKRWYVVANILKSFYLGALVSSKTYRAYLWTGFVMGEWDQMQDVAFFVKVRTPLPPSIEIECK